MSTDLITLSGPAMGSRWTARLSCDPNSAAGLTAALGAAVETVEAQMSAWRPLSDLNRLNAAPTGLWVDLPPEILTVLAEAQRIGAASGGLFDIGVGGLVQAWGFGPAAGRSNQAAMAAALGKPIAGAAALELDLAGQRARKNAPMQLDLAGIAKGYGVDRLAKAAQDNGVSQALLGLDGEMVALGSRPDGKPWAVALEAPDPTRRAAQGVIELQGRALATSGNYRHFVDLGGARLSHSMNPRRGGPAVNALASVSVLADSCMGADAWATVLMVLGETAGPEFARATGLDAIFIANDGQMTMVPGRQG